MKTVITANRWPVAPTITVTQKPAPRPEHPILRNEVSIEVALADLLETAKKHAVSVNRHPEQDMVAEAVFRDHGALAAAIADPVQSALLTAVDVLFAHAKKVMPPDRFSAMVERLRVHVGKGSRYAADSRPRH